MCLAFGEGEVMAATKTERVRVIVQCSSRARPRALAADKRWSRELRDVSDVVGYAGAEEHSDQFATVVCRGVTQGGMALEDAARRESGRCCGGKRRESRCRSQTRSLIASVDVS